MCLMAINAANLIRGVRARHPVADFLIACVAAHADAVGIRGRTLGKGDDFRNVTTAIHV
jgi:hypothetical protein